MNKQWQLSASRAWRLVRAHPRKAGLAAIVLIGGITFVGRSFSKHEKEAITFHETRRGDFLVSIVEGGTLKAVKEEFVRCEMEGSSRIIYIVPEGTNVHTGDLLVELDSSDLKERVNSQDVTYQNTLFNYVQARENLEIQQSVIRSQIMDQELRLKFARSDLRKYQEGDLPQLKKNSEAKITIITEELERARDRYSWTTKLQAKGYATKSEEQADSLAVKRKEIELSQATEDRRLLQEFDAPKRIEQLEANVEQQDQELDRMRKRTANTVAQLDASLKSQKNTLELQEKRLNELREQLKLTRIYAPKDGLVVYASSANPGSGVLIEEGAMVRQKQDIIKLPDMSEMMLEIRVHESHVQKVKPEMAAWVTLDSIPDRRFRGSVRKVAVLPDSTRSFYNPNLKVYTTEVLVEDDLPMDLKPGISGRAEIVITNLQDVLTVPIQAVTTIQGQQVCLVQKGSVFKPVQVEVGLFNDKLIEIKSGLRAGDRVQLAALSSDNLELPEGVSPKTNAMADAPRSPRSPGHRGKANGTNTALKAGIPGVTGNPLPAATGVPSPGTAVQGAAAPVVVITSDRRTTPAAIPRTDVGSSNASK